MTALSEDLVLEGEGLWVRRPREADAEAILRACHDPDVVRFTRVPAAMTIEDVHDFRLSGARDALEGTAFHAVAVDGDGTLLGACGLVDVDWLDLVGEVGYWTAPDHRGRGVATRATRAVCRWAFDDLGLERLQLEASVRNPASNRVARRLGFQWEGTRRQAFVPGHTGQAGTDRDDVHLHGLLSGELT